jgi:hypothetical protein
MLKESECSEIADRKKCFLKNKFKNENYKME